MADSGRWSGREQKWLWISGTFNGDGAIGQREKTLRLDFPQLLTHAQRVHERAIHFFTFFLLNKWERERVGNELIRADEWRHEKVARTYQPNIVGLIWRCAGVGQHWPPHWSGDALSDHPDQHRGYRGSRGPASFSRSRFRHLSRGLRGGSSWHWKPTRPIGPGSGMYISSLALYDSYNNAFSLHSELKGHRNYWIVAWKSTFCSPSSKLCSKLCSLSFSPPLLLLLYVLCTLSLTYCIES